MTSGRVVPGHTAQSLHPSSHPQAKAKRTAQAIALLPFAAGILLVVLFETIVALCSGSSFNAGDDESLMAAMLTTRPGLVASSGGIGGEDAPFETESTESVLPRGRLNNANVAIATALLADQFSRVSYTALACALGLQLRDLYPAVERIALVGTRSGASEGHLRRCGFTRVVPGPANLSAAIPRCSYKPGWVYGDQSVKFALWNIAEYGRITYFDADTFFYYNDADAMRSALAPLFDLSGTGGDELRGCPAPWSNISMNGGLFSLEPSRMISSRLFQHGKSSFFSRNVGRKHSWFDCTEMGPLNELYEGRWKVVDDPGSGAVCVSTDTKKLTTKNLESRPFVYHGLKPTNIGLRQWRNEQRKKVFQKRGYSDEALAVIDAVFDRLLVRLKEAGTILLTNQTV